MRPPHVLLILALFLLAWFTGCVGTRLYDLTTESGASARSALERDLLDVPVSATLTNGRVLDGRFEMAAEETLLFKHEGLDSSVLIGLNRIHSAETPGCWKCVLGGSILGLLAGIVILESNSEGDTPTSAFLAGMALGAAAGGTTAGFIFRAKRYTITSLPKGADTLWIANSHVISVTNTRIRVLQDEGPVSYDRAVVRLLRRGSFCALIRPAPHPSQ